MNKEFPLWVPEKNNSKNICTVETFNDISCPIAMAISHIKVLKVNNGCTFFDTVLMEPFKNNFFLQYEDAILMYLHLFQLTLH